jgi:hypothetical protein
LSYLAAGQPNHFAEDINDDPRFILGEISKPYLTGRIVAEAMKIETIYY